MTPTPELVIVARDATHAANIGLRWSVTKASITLQDALIVLQQITFAHCAMQEVVNRLKGEQPPKVGP